jgi:flagellar basal-body rod modification protein FlgD
MASAINALTGSSGSTAGAASAASTSSSGSSSSSGTANAPTEQMFLQLLVAQLQNQDPLNPTDSTQFVSQLAQFSELEQVIGIRGDIETYMGQNSASTTPATSSTTTTSSSTPSTSGTTSTTAQTES